MKSITEQDIEQAIPDGNGNRIIRLALSDPIFILSYIDSLPFPECLFSIALGTGKDIAVLK